MQLSSPRAQRLAVAFLVAVLVATVALLFVTAHRVAHAEGVSAPAAAPLRPPRSTTGTGGQNAEERATPSRPTTTAPACEWNRYNTPRNCSPDRRPAEPGGGPR